MKNITIVDKASGTASEHTFGTTSLKGTSIVKLPFGPESVQSFQQSGQNLVVTLKSGETVTIQNFFVVGSDGAANQLVLENADGTLWLGKYSSPYSGFTFGEISALDDLTLATVAADSSVPSWVLWGLGLLAVGGVGAAINSSGGGGGGGGSADGGSVTPPSAANGLSVNAAGTVVSGRGQPGTTVTIKDAAGNILGSGKVGADGNFQVNLDSPQTNGEALEVTLTDPLGNTSPATPITAEDKTAPASPSGLVVSSDGSTVSGKGEPGSTVTIKDANGNVIGSGTVGADGNFQIGLTTPVTNGEALQVTLTDKAGNESSAGTVTTGDTTTEPGTPPVTSPAAPTNIAVSADGTTVTGKGAAGSVVTIKDANGKVIGSGTVGADGNFQIVLGTPLAKGDTLQVTQTDSAGNESTGGNVIVGGVTDPGTPPIVAPSLPTELSVSSDGTTVNGRGQPGTAVTIKDANGDLVGTGTVGADGNFQIVLSKPGLAGELLEVTLQDGAGNQSSPGVVIVGGVTLPGAPTDLSLSADGLTLSGKGQAGHAITIKNDKGDIVGTGTVAADGTFDITLSSAHINGQTLFVRLTNLAGNESLPGSVVAGGAPLPDAPTGLVVSADGTTVSGKGAPGSTITIKDANGNPIGTGTVGADGNFQVVLDTPSTNGATLQVILTDSAGNESLPGTVVVGGPVTLPDAPTGLTVSADGTTVSGKGAPGSTITIKDANGNPIGSGTVGADGNFQIVLGTPSTTGATLQVILTDSAGNESLPGTVVVGGPVTLPDAPTGLVVSADGTTVSGKGAPGSTITIKDANGNPIGTGTVGADGNFQVVLVTPSTNGATLQVVLKDSAGNESLPGTVVVGGPVTLPDAPTGLAVSADGTTVSGKGAPGSTITIKDGTGDVIGTGTVGADGNFQVVLVTPSTTGATLQVVQKDSAGNESLPGTVVVGGPVTLPDAPTGLAVSADGTTVSGKGLPGSTITIKDGTGDVIGTGTVGADGNFQVVLDTPSTTGATLQVVQKDSAGNESLPGTVVVGGPVTLPDAPTGLTVSADGTTVSGKGASGSTITIKDADGDVIGSGTVAADGNFQVVLDTPSTNGATLQVILTDSAGNESLPGTVVVGAPVTLPDAPTGLVVSADGTTVSGKGAPGSTITIKDANGNPIGTGTVGADGNFQVVLVTPSTNGATLQVVLKDSAGNESLPGTVVVGGPVTLPDAPTGLTVSADGTTLSGKGLPGAAVTVRDVNGDIVGVGTVGNDGNFQIVLIKPGLDGEVLEVTLQDDAGNQSLPGVVIVGGATVPGAPTDLSLSADGLTLSGKGQAGHTITIKNDKGDVVGSGTVAADGTFDIPLTSAHIKGETLFVRLTDLAGNESLPGSVVAGGTPGLNAPTDVTVSADGITVSGKGEPGAAVTVKDAGGQVIGTGTVGVGGNFEVTLNTAQVNGETLAVTLKDGAGNESGPTTVTAPDVDGNGTDPDLEAFDDLATALVTIKPVASNTPLPNVHVFTLAAVGEVIVIGEPVKSQTFSVAEGMSGTLNLGFVQGNFLSLLGGGLTATLEVSDGKGGWLPVQQGSTGGGLLDLLGLFGSNSSAKVEGLAAGQYRFTLKLDPNLLTLGAAATAVLSVTNNSLTDFEGVAGPEISGNVITDPGFGGKPDSQGSGGVATIQVEVNGQLVDAAAVGTPGTVLQGQYGQLTIFANGDYKYTPNGDIASIGKVDAFEYHLVTAAGGSASATLYVRIDSPNSDVTWSTTNPSAPGVIDTVANDDVGSARIDIDNVVGPAKVLDALTYTLPVLAGVGSGTGATITVAADTKADLAINVSATGLAVIPNTTVNLQKLVDSGWVTQQTVETQGHHIFTGLDAGSYRVTASTTSVLSLSTMRIAQTLTPTYLTQFVVGQMTSAKGNVLAEGLSGADSLGSPLTALSVSVSPGNYVTPGQIGTIVKGEYGTLTLFANGDYTYKPDAGLKLADIGKVDSFTYKLTHPTGKEDTATLYIRIDTPDRDLVWDDANPGAPATEGNPFAASEVAALAAVTDESGDAEGDSGSDDGEAVALADTEFSLVDGVAGLDTLQWEGGDAAINLTDLIGKVSGIQSIDLNSFSSVDLTLSLEDLVSVIGPDADRLFIQGDGQDSVHLTGDWASVATQVANGLEYVIYTAQEDETHQLWVQSGVSVV